MGDTQRDGSHRAILDEDRPERVALLDSRRFGEPVPVDALRRHPSSAARPADRGGLALFRALDRPGKLRLVTMAEHRDG